MKDSAPPNPVVAANSPSAQGSDELNAITSLAGRLTALGARPVVQPTTIAPSPGSLLAVHGAAALLGTAMGWLWPLPGLALLIATAWSALREAEGHRGWLRAWIPRQVGHNVVVWGRREASSARPCLLVVGPLDEGDGRAPRSSVALVALAAPGLLGALGVIAARFTAELGQTLLVGACGALGLTVIAALIVAAARPWRRGAGPACSQIEALLPGVLTAPPEHLDVVLAWTSGGPCGDAMEILLTNNAHKLPPEHTRALLLSASSQGSALVNVEGRWRRRAVDPLIARSAAEVGLPVTSGVSAATRAMDAGWRCATLNVDASTTGTALPRLIQQLDHAAGERRW